MIFRLSKSRLLGTRNGLLKFFEIGGFRQILWPFQKTKTLKVHFQNILPLACHHLLSHQHFVVVEVYLLLMLIQNCAILDALVFPPWYFAALKVIVYKSFIELSLLGVIQQLRGPNFD